MTATSWAKRIIDISNASYSDGNPISAGVAFLARNNYAHIVDESAQHRVNWARVDLRDNKGYMCPVMKRSQYVPWLRRAWEFPLSWLGPEKPANLSLIVDWGGVDASDSEQFTCRTVICPARSPLWSGQNAIYDNTAISTAGFGSMQALIVGADNLPVLADAWEVVGTVEDNTYWYQPRLCMMRLEIVVTFDLFHYGGYEPTTLTDYVQIFVCALQEYA